VLHDAGHRVDQWVKLSEQTFEFACAARKRFAKGDAGTKKEILLAIGSNLTLKDKILRIEARKPFFILEKSLPAGEQQNEAIEPDTKGIPQRQKAPNGHLRTRQSGDLDDVRTFTLKWLEPVRSVQVFSEKVSLHVRGMSE